MRRSVVRAIARRAAPTGRQTERSGLRDFFGRRAARDGPELSDDAGRVSTHSRRRRAKAERLRDGIPGRDHRISGAPRAAKLHELFLRATRPDAHLSESESETKNHLRETSGHGAIALISTIPMNRN